MESSVFAGNSFFLPHLSCSLNQECHGLLGFTIFIRPQSMCMSVRCNVIEIPNSGNVHPILVCYTRMVFSWMKSRTTGLWTPFCVSFDLQKI